MLKAIVMLMFDPVLKLQSWFSELYERHKIIEW